MNKCQQARPQQNKYIQHSMINTYWSNLCYKVMYNLTLFVKAGNREESFNFPNSRVTKEVVQNLVTNLTNEPIHAFDISYCDHEDNITLSIEEDYQNAIVSSFQQMDVLISVTTEREVQFVYMDDYKHRPNQGKPIYKTISELSKQISLQKQELKIKQKLNSNTKKMSRKHKKDNNRKSNDHFLNISKKIEQGNVTNKKQIVNSIAIEKYKEQFQGSKQMISKISTGENTYLMQSIAELNCGELLDGLIKQYPLLDIPDQENEKSQQMKDNQIRPLSLKRSDKSSVQKEITVTEGSNQRNNDKDAHRLTQIKEDIIRQVLDRLPLYLRQQCFKNQASQPELFGLPPNIQPICCNCRKTLNAKDKRQWKKQVVNQQLKQIYPANYATLECQGV